MKNLENVEVFYIEEPNKDGEMFAWISYRNPNHESTDLNNGYDNIRVPVNLRLKQYSSRGNLLVNQSEKEESKPENITQP